MQAAHWKKLIIKIILLLEAYMSFLKERFGKHLKELRKAKSLTQEQMAEIVGI